MQLVRYQTFRRDILAMALNTGLIPWSETSSDTRHRGMMIFRTPDTSPERVWPEEWLKGPSLPAHVSGLWIRFVEAVLRAAARRTANSLRHSDGRRVLGRLGRPVLPQVNAHARGQVWAVLRRAKLTLREREILEFDADQILDQRLWTILREPVGPLAAEQEAKNKAESRRANDNGHP